MDLEGTFFFSSLVVKGIFQYQGCHCAASQSKLHRRTYGHSVHQCLPGLLLWTLGRIIDSEEMLSTPLDIRLGRMMK